MDNKYDAIIIGAGVIGCAVAFELAKRGYKTLNIDKKSTAGFGSTGNSCAIVRAHYSTWDGVAMAYENFFYWLDWKNYLGVEDELGYARYMNTGTILLKSQGHDYEKVLKQFNAVGVKYEEWTPEQVTARLPIYELSEHWPPKRPEDDSFWDDPEEMLVGGVYTPESGYVNDPILATHNLMRAAEAHGGEFIFEAEVTEIRKEDNHVLGVTLTSGEEIDAPVVVNIAGPHSFVINRMAGIEGGMNIKTRALRHEVHHVPSPEGFDFEKVGMHTSDGDLGLYYRPETGNTILVGSEDPECDPQVWVDDPDNYQDQLTDAQWKAQVYRLAKRIPDLPIPNQPRGIVDLYDVSDDWLPIYDKSDLKGFYMAIGTSGNQFKNAPGVGHLMAELIDACEKGHDHDHDPVQVKMPYTGIVLNAGFYSRNRKINPNSSFSVNG
jgi:sarcosine oxidase, subunit beta